MKTTTTLISACALLAIAGQSAALPSRATGFSFTPANQSFSGSGQLSFQIARQPTVNCNVSVTGQTGSAGALSITSLTYSDNGDGTCSDVSSPNASEEYWNPTADHSAKWTLAQFILSPKGIKCSGGFQFTVDEPVGSDTMVNIHNRLPSPAGTCILTGQLDIGNVVISRTPGQ
jgi:hypothetical protein